MEMECDITSIEEESIDQYLNDPVQRPWIIAFSGGKDSATLLQVVWNWFYLHLADFHRIPIPPVIQKQLNANNTFNKFS